MKLHPIYTCQEGHQIALEVDALNDIPEIIRQRERTLLAKCWDCEGSRDRGFVVEGSKIKEVGYCELRLGKITE
ncbi:hypothetical protein [Bacteroides sp.]|uniref:hypothetical protein n=1 Tax=Bacteroides sp. TaxID=29523 RepID=UPI00260DBE07|nr:hypothetical protein [Bacteroides sp.]MDD3040997.1 hypothetical protein [Bacteroides sp.]